MTEIVILTNSDVGLFKFRRELLEELVKNYRVVIASPGSVYVHELTDLGCLFHQMDFKPRGKNLFLEAQLYLAYRKMLKQYHPALVLTYTIKPNLYGGMACRYMGIPYIATITGLGTAIENRNPFRNGLLILYKYSLCRASHVFFQNEENQKFMLEHSIGNHCSSVIPGSGVNLTQYKQLPYLSKNKMEFLFISRVMKEKGIQEYLEAAAEIKRKYPCVVFHICGSCDESYRNMLRLYEQKGIIVYHGMIKNTIEMYGKVSCVIHPTYYPEGLSNVLLESCACGRPIITTNRSGCREVIRDGVNGFLVKEKSSQDLIEKIETFIRLPYAQKVEMSFNARKLVEEKFDRQVVVRAYLNEIKEVLNDRQITESL